MKKVLKTHAEIFFFQNSSLRIAIVELSQVISSYFVKINLANKICF